MTAVTKARRSQKSKVKARSKAGTKARSRTGNTAGTTADSGPGRREPEDAAAPETAGETPDEDPAEAGAAARGPADPADPDHPDRSEQPEHPVDPEKPLPHPAEQAFDDLYAEHARPLTRQAYLLCGHRRVAEHAVGHAFHLAWERWPEVALDRDPAGWVRAAAHEYALSPWHQFHPRRRDPQAHPGPPADRALRDALLILPRSYRRALLLHDGLGISLSDTAAESEASRPATLGRVFQAREQLSGMLPELREAPAGRRPELIANRLRLLADTQSVHARPAEAVRSSSERTTRRRTRASFGLTALVVTAVAVAIVTAETRSVDPADQEPAHSVGPPPGPEDGGWEDGDWEDSSWQAYAPQLRSANHRVHLDEEGAPPE